MNPSFLRAELMAVVRMVSSSGLNVLYREVAVGVDVWIKPFTFKKLEFEKVSGKLNTKHCATNIWGANTNTHTDAAWFWWFCEHYCLLTADWNHNKKINEKSSISILSVQVRTRSIPPASHWSERALGGGNRKKKNLKQISSANIFLQIIWVHDWREVH